MAQQTINVGATDNDGTGDVHRVAFQKINDNFTEVYGFTGGIEEAPIDGNIYGRKDAGWEVIVASALLDLQGVLDNYNIADKELIIRNDLLDKFIAVAKGSKDLSMFADRILHSSNGESATGLVFEETLLPAEVLVRNLSGTIAYLDDITALLEGLSWKQKVELNLNSGITMSGVIPTISSLTQQGHTLVNDSRVIVSAAPNPIYNGFYRVNSTPVSGAYRLYRTSDANTSAELTNAVVDVSYGTFKNQSFRQATANPVIGTDNIVFEDFGSSVASATNLIAGIAKLYNALGSQEDGGITPKAVNDALALKVDKETGKSLLADTEITKVSFITITQPVNLDDIETRVNELDAVVILKGTWDCTTGAFPASTQAGWSYLVTGATTTISGIEFNAGDRLISVLDNASTSVYAGNWYKADYTDRVNTVAGRTGNVVITSSDLSDFNTAVNSLIATALATFKTDNYLDGITSSIQGQIDGKEDTSNKATDFSVINNTKFPTTQAVNNLVDSRSSTIKYLTANVLSTIITNTIINDLTFNVVAGERYVVRGNIRNGCSGVGGVKFATTFPSGCTGVLQAHASGGSITGIIMPSHSHVTSGTLQNAVTTFVTTAGTYFIEGTIFATANGSFTFAFASTTAGQTSTIYAEGSYIEIIRVQ